MATNLSNYFWWWVGLTDRRKPKGEQALGCVIVSAPEEAHAGLLVRNIIGINLDHIELYIGRMPREHGDPPGHVVGRVLGLKEAENLVATWIPGGRLATPDEVRRAILNDDAPEGTPLFTTPVKR